MSAPNTEQRCPTCTTPPDSLTDRAIDRVGELVVALGYLAAAVAIAVVLIVALTPDREPPGLCERLHEPGSHALAECQDTDR